MVAAASSTVCSRTLSPSRAADTCPSAARVRIALVGTHQRRFDGVGEDPRRRPRPRSHKSQHGDPRRQSHTPHPQNSILHITRRKQGRASTPDHPTESLSPPSHFPTKSLAPREHIRRRGAKEPLASSLGGNSEVEALKPHLPIRSYWKDSNQQRTKLIPATFLPFTEPADEPSEKYI